MYVRKCVTSFHVKFLLFSPAAKLCPDQLDQLTTRT